MQNVQAKNPVSQFEIKKMSNDVCALSAEKNKLASEVEALRRNKANSSSKNLVRCDGSSPRNVHVVLPCPSPVLNVGE